jgi:hypothetical protein
MAAINDDVYARVREKVKEHNLTEQEVKAIDTARDQLQTHSKKWCEKWYIPCTNVSFSLYWRSRRRLRCLLFRYCKKKKVNVERKLLLNNIVDQVKRKSSILSSCLP